MSSHSACPHHPIQIQVEATYDGGQTGRCAHCNMIVWQRDLFHEVYHATAPPSKRYPSGPAAGPAGFAPTTVYYTNETKNVLK